jgi:hypothetical protein
MFFEKTNKSYWKTKFNTFEVLSYWNKVINNDKPRLKLNKYRIVEINTKLYLEISTQLQEITFGYLIGIKIRNINLKVLIQNKKQLNLS